MGDRTPAGATPDVAVDLCMEDMKHASALPFEDGVIKAVRDQALPKFVEHQAIWPAHEDRVREAARTVGRIAELLARLKGRHEVGLDQAQDAIRAVKNNCGAGAATVRFKWCPDWGFTGPSGTTR